MVNMPLKCDKLSEIIPYEIQVTQFFKQINLSLLCVCSYSQELIIHRHLIWDAFIVSRIRRVCRLWRDIVDDLYRRRKAPVPQAKVGSLLTGPPILVTD